MVREVQPALVGQTLDVPGRVDTLDGEALGLEALERRVGGLARADQFAVKAVSSAERGHQLIPDPCEAQCGLGSAAEGGYQLGELMRGLGEQRRLGVLEVP